MKLKKHLTMLSAAIGVTAIATLPITHLTKSATSNAVINDTNQDASATKAASYSNYYTQGNLESISTTSGPITLKNEGKIVQSLDWYGNVNWSYDVSTLDSANQSTKIVDWNFLEINSWIFLITDKSTLIKINASTGELNAILSQSESGIVTGANRIASIEFNNTMYVWNSENKKPEISEVDRNTLKKKNNGTTIQTEDTNSYLVNILPIAVGYNVGIFSNVAVKDDTSFNSATITLKFLDDSMKKITNSNDATLDSKTNNNFKNFASYSFIRKNNTSNPLLIVDNTLFNVTLNKSDMSKSKIEKLEMKINNVNETVTQFYNSAFMDVNETIYFKEFGGKKIYQINFNNIISVFNDISTANNSTLVSIVNNTDNNLQIYGVPSTAEAANTTLGLEKKYLSGTMSLFASENPYIGVVLNSAIPNTDYSLQKPTLLATSTGRKLPSFIKKTDFKSQSANTLNANNVTLKADDYAGTLTVKATVTKPAWYNQNTNTTSIINETYNTNNASNWLMDLSNAVSMANQQNFSNQFGNSSPNQLVESDLNNWSGMFTFNNSGLTASDVTTQVSIVSRDDTKGTLEVEGLIRYTDQYGQEISYSLNKQTYTIKKGATNYALKFYGSKNNANGWMQSNGQTVKNDNEDIDIRDVTDTTVSGYQKYLPSLITKDMWSTFIEVEDKYVKSDKIVSAVADDKKGELTITVMYNKVDYTVAPYKYVQKYTGFVTEDGAKIGFLGNKETNEEVLNAFQVAGDEFKDNILDITTVQGYSSFSTKISTLVQPGEVTGVFTTKLAAMGITPTVTIEERKTIDDANGSFIVTLDYSGGKDDPTKLKGSYANKFGLNNFKISQRYSGMLDIGNLYGIEINQTKAKQVVNKYDVNSTIPTDEILSTLDIKGYVTNSTDVNQNDFISIQSFNWDGENFYFTVSAKSRQYPTVTDTKRFNLSWAPKFRAIRERNMAIAISTAIVGAAIVSTAITLYILRRNRIRRLLK